MHTLSWIMWPLVANLHAIGALIGEGTSNEEVAGGTGNCER